MGSRWDRWGPVRSPRRGDAPPAPRGDGFVRSRSERTGRPSVGRPGRSASGRPRAGRPRRIRARRTRRTRSSRGRAARVARGARKPWATPRRDDDPVVGLELPSLDDRASAALEHRSHVDERGEAPGRSRRTSSRAGADGGAGRAGRRAPTSTGSPGRTTGWPGRGAGGAGRSGRTRWPATPRGTSHARRRTAPIAPYRTPGEVRRRALETHRAVAWVRANVGA